MNLHVNEPCPCASGRRVAACCLRNGRLFPAAAHIVAPLGSYANPRCYARNLGGCSKTISIEHYISKSVLLLLSGGSELIPIDGFPWQRPDGPPSITVSKLGANVLCTLHNEALSPLDKIGRRFMENLLDIGPYYGKHPSGGPDKKVLINGHDIERWLIKLTLGLGLVLHPDWKPPLSWIRILYGKRQMPGSHGLVFDAPVGDITSPEKRIGVAPLYLGSNIIGVVALLNGFRFGLVMASAAPELGLFRPGSVTFRSVVTGQQQYLWLGWRAPHGTKSVNVDWHPGG
jgi:hypothetical protein